MLIKVVTCAYLPREGFSPTCIPRESLSQLILGPACFPIQGRVLAPPVSLPKGGSEPHLSPSQQKLSARSSGLEERWSTLVSDWRRIYHAHTCKCDVTDFQHHACMCVCVCVRVHVRVHVRVYVYVYKCMYMYIVF